MSTHHKPEKRWRIGVVSTLESMNATHYQDGVYRRAESIPEVTIQKFNADAAHVRRGLLARLREWKPQGLIVSIADLDLLRNLRHHYPSLPFVSMIAVPPDLVDTVVVGDIADALATVRDYFRKCGLANMAVFCFASKAYDARFVEILREIIPDGRAWICPKHVVEAGTASEKERQRRIVTDGLRTLPKPVGIMTRETEAAAFLLSWCKNVGLRVPEDVQIIGQDEEDLCLACEPRLTSIVPPRRRIGEAALDAMMRLLKKERPPPLIRISGATIVPRGSTDLVRVGRSVVRRSIDHMQAYAALGLTMADVTRQSKVGRTTFYRQFGETTGQTPAQYLRKMRLEEACRLLRETDETATAIGQACGFKSIESFINFFRRQTGQTPTAYRKKKKR